MEGGLPGRSRSGRRLAHAGSALSSRVPTLPSSQARTVRIRSLLSLASSSSSSELPPRGAATSCGAKEQGYAPGPAARRQRRGRRRGQADSCLEGLGPRQLSRTVDLGRSGGWGGVTKRGGERLPWKRIRCPAGGRTAEGFLGRFEPPP